MKINTKRKYAKIKIQSKRKKSVKGSFDGKNIIAIRHKVKRQKQTVIIKRWTNI